MDFQLDAIKASIDLRVYISNQGIKLKQSGLNWAGLCPFHKEATPSFHVSTEKQMYICRGCSAGGDLFSFVQRFHGVSFIEAKKMLAEEAGISLDRFTPEERLAYAKHRAEIERAEAWRQMKIQEIEDMRNDYFGLYHQSKRLIRKHGLALMFIGAHQCGEKYQRLDELLGLLKTASFHSIAVLCRAEDEIE